MGDPRITHVANWYAFAAPLIGILCAALEHFGIWDKWSSRDKAIEGLRRLRSGRGYPVSWIYDDPDDKDVFDALLIRIKKITQETKIKSAINARHKPSLITVAGEPIVIRGVPEYWPDEAKFFYADNHPVLAIFGASRIRDSRGKTDKSCTLRDIDDWLRTEKEDRKFYVGTVMIGVLSLVLILLRTQLVPA